MKPHCTNSPRKKKSIFISFIVLALLLSACSPRPKAEDTVKQFIGHMNAYNANGCIALLSSDIANQANASLSLGSMFSNKMTGFNLDGNTMIALLPMMTSFLSLAGFGMDLPQWRAENYQAKETGNTARVTCNMHVSMGSSAEDRYTAYFDLEYKDGKWLITGMQ